MPPDSDNSNEPHRLDDVSKRLYRRDLANRHVKRFDILRPRPFPVKHDWEKSAEPAEKISKIASHPSFFKKFFLYALGFAGLAVVFAVIMFFTGGNTVSSNNIEINVLGNSFAAGGEQVPLQVEVVNKNSSPLQLADLFVQYQKGGDTSGGAQMVRTLNSLGTIAAGQTSTKNIFLTLYGSQESVQNIDFTLQYRIAGSNAIFVKDSTFPITISSAPLELSVDSPASLSPNQTLTFTAKIKSNSANTVSGVLVRIDYPSGFKFDKASPDPTSFSNVWDLGDLAPGVERDITISGTVYGQDGEDRGFHVYAGAKSASDGTQIGVVYNSLLQVVSLVKPFISADLLINGSSETTVPVPSASSVNVSVQWANNLPTQVTDAEITVAISGNAIDGASVVAPKGFYNSATQTIVWNSTTDPDLATIQPSDSGSLDFSFQVSPLWQAGQQVITSPAIQFSVSMKGKQSDAGGAVSDVTNFEQKTAVVSSDLGFSEDAFYRSGPFSNTGPIPPQANQPTTYTVTWTVTNSANPLASATAAATLPTYVDWVGTISPQTEQVQYDDTTRTITWNIGQVPVGAGLSGAARAVSFQVRLTPSTSQVGSTPKLLLNTNVTAQDTYTNQQLSVSRDPISTLLSNDPGFPVNGEIITQ